MQIWAAAQDSTGNLNEVIQVVETRTLDAQGPHFVLGTPAIAPAAPTPSGPQTDTVAVALDEPGSVTCVLQPCSAALSDAQCAAAMQPSALQILADEVVSAAASAAVGLDAADIAADLELVWTQVSYSPLACSRSVPVPCWSASGDLRTLGCVSGPLVLFVATCWTPRLRDLHSSSRRHRAARTRVCTSCSL